MSDVLGKGLTADLTKCFTYTPTRLMQLACVVLDVSKWLALGMAFGRVMTIQLMGRTV